jgi:hypothetical protein
MLYQVTSSYYCAGIITTNSGFVIKAAPILKWTIGKSIKYLQQYFTTKGFTIQALEQRINI